MNWQKKSRCYKRATRGTPYGKELSSFTVVTDIQTYKGNLNDTELYTYTNEFR